jgi:hypothetical protein
LILCDGEPACGWAEPGTGESLVWFCGKVCDDVPHQLDDVLRTPEMVFAEQDVGDGSGYWDYEFKGLADQRHVGIDPREPLTGPGDSVGRRAPWVPVSWMLAPQCQAVALLVDAQAAGPVPARKFDSAGGLQVLRPSGGVPVFVEQAAKDRFSADLPCIAVGRGGAGTSRS